jgi:peptide/nickel transport system permease protein
MSSEGKGDGSSVGLVMRMWEGVRPRWDQFRILSGDLAANKLAMVGLLMVLSMVVMAIFAPVLAPPAPNTDPMIIPKDWYDPKPPGMDGHILGTGDQGVDIFYGIVWGARTTITACLVVVLVSAILGTMVGAVSGYYGGKVDEVLMRVTDIFLSLPALILAMAITAVLSHSFENIMLALIVVWWPAYARLVRAQVLVTRESTYVEAARSIGAKKGRILFRHIVPNSLSPLIANITMDIGAVALVLASLSYIGFGVQSGYAEWGRMVSDGHGWFLSTVTWNGVQYNPWWVVTIPGSMILMFTMGFSLMGDALRDILDPRSRR